MRLGVERLHMPGGGEYRSRHPLSELLWPKAAKIYILRGVA